MTAEVKFTFQDSTYSLKLNRAKLESIMIILMLSTSLILGIATMSTSVQARIYSGVVEIELPQYVVPGGYLLVSTDPIPPDAAGGSIYFYLSKDDDPEILSGDILLGSMRKVNVKTLNTLKIPVSTRAGEYYLKMTDSSLRGSLCLVSDSSVEVVTEDLPKISVDPESEVVGVAVDVEGEDISEDYDVVELFWDDYNKTLGTLDVEDKSFTAKDLDIPNAFMGENAIVILLHDEDNGEYLGTYVDFEVEPSITTTPPTDFSIKAGSNDAQEVMINAYGFPEGEIDDDSITYILKDISTGIKVDTYTSEHEKVEVNDTSGFEGRIIDLKTTVHDVDEGVIDIQFEINGETVTMEEELISSTTGDIGEFRAKMYSTRGSMGDKVKFQGLNFPAGVDVEIEFVGDVMISLDAGSSDDNGAWRSTITLEDIPGGKYDVRVKDATNARHKTIGTFEILSSIDLPDEAVVDSLIDIIGEGFKVGSKYDTVEIKGVKVEIDVMVGSNGILEAPVKVPHVSGGGQKVSVKIMGEDANGKSITITSSIIIEPKAVALEALTSNGIWKDASGEMIFSGTPMRFRGIGFKAGESPNVNFENGDGVTRKANVNSYKAESNGDLLVIFQVPTGKDFIDKKEWKVTIAGSTDGNEWEGKIDIEDLDDDEAKIYFGLTKDGKLTNEVKTGASITVIGTGFQTSKLTLEFGGEKVKDVTSSYGYFSETIKVPTVEKGSYRLTETKTGAQSLIVYIGIPAVFLNAPPNTIYFIFSDPAYATNAKATYDVAAGGMVYGLCANVQNLGFNTTPDWLLPSGAVDTATISGSWVAMFGGPITHVAVRYYEDEGLTPIKFSANATHYTFVDQANTVIAALPTVDLAGGHEDMFLVETYTDAGNTFFVVYGFSWKGTWGGGIYFKDTMSKDLSSYNKAYYVFHWIDDSNQDGVPQSSEILEYASEK